MSSRGASLLALSFLLLPGLAACKDREQQSEVRPSASAEGRAPSERGGGVRGAPGTATEGTPPVVLYLPDASAAPRAAPASTRVVRDVASRCPPEMVEVHAAFCIDRYEASLVDAATGQRLSPYYPPSPEATRREYRRWQRARANAPTEAGKSLAVPPPPEWALSAERFDAMATSVPGSVPNGYLSGEVASRACARAGKRLCRAEEWVTACRGKRNTVFPYGHHYEYGRCNVFRETHPARVLHGDPSIGHLDPRLHLVLEGGSPLLKPTAETPDCVSEWGPAAAHDMVGNLDEWVDEPGGTFVGGFYARSTQKGCDARVEVHSFDYYDYSLGARCCRGL